MRRSGPPDRPLISGWFGFPLGFVAGVVVTFAAVGVGATGFPVISLVLLLAVVNAIAVLSTPLAAAGTAAVCWAMHAEFVLGHHGELSFSGVAARDAGILLGSAVAMATVAALLRAATRVRGNVGE